MIDHEFKMHIKSKGQAEVVLSFCKENHIKLHENLSYAMDHVDENISRYGYNLFLVYINKDEGLTWLCAPYQKDVYVGYSPPEYTIKDLKNAVLYSIIRQVKEFQLD